MYEFWRNKKCKDVPQEPQCTTEVLFCMMGCMKEESCGCIPFYRDKQNTVQYLLVFRSKGYWEFPKGKPEEGESEVETAQRELREETGLVGNLIAEHVFEVHYTFERLGKVVQKKVLLYPCRIIKRDEVRIDGEEVVDYAWLSHKEVIERMNYPEMKAVVKKAHHLIRGMKD